MRLSPILLSVALLCASAQALATESRPMGADENGNCPENATAANAEEVDSDAAAAPAARRTQKAKPAAARSSNTGGGNRGNAAPRWHSFLPGMFR